MSSDKPGIYAPDLDDDSPAGSGADRRGLGAPSFSNDPDDDVPKSSGYITEGDEAEAEPAAEAPVA